jgi:Tfp pilus assembly protein PilN
MIAGTLSKKLLFAGHILNRRMEAFLDIMRKTLFFSLADDRVSRRKGVSVSIEKGSIAVVSGSRFLSRISVRTAKNFSFDPASYPDPEACASSVVLTKAELATKKADVVLSIPKAWTVATVTEFPATIKENLLEAMRHELDRLTPFSPEEALYDFQILGESEGKLTVLVVAAKTAAVMPYLDALKNKGINVSCVTSHLSSLGVLSEFSRGLRDFIMLRDREDACEATLFLNGSARSVFTAGKSEVPSEELHNSLRRELASFGERLRHEGRQPQLVLSSETDGPSIKDLLVRETGLTVIPAEEFMREGTVVREEKGPILPAYSGLIQLLWPNSRAFDLLSRGVRKQTRAPLVLTVILASALIVSGLVYLYAPLELEKKRSSEIDRMIAARKDEVRKVEDFRKQVDALAAEIGTIRSFRKKPLTVNVVREVTKILPSEIWLTHLHVSETQVDIEGYAASATGLIQKLESSPLLSRAELVSATIRDQRMNADRFSIKAEIEGAKKDEKAGEAKHEKK